MRPARTRLQVLEAMVVLSLFVMSVGCNGFFVDPTLTSIAVSPTSGSVIVKQTIQFSAFGTYDDGTRKTISSGLSWSSSSPTNASIDQKSGTATGITAGTTDITASAQGLTSPTATLTIIPTGITSITIAPLNATIAISTSRNFTATAQDGSDVTQLVTWTSSNTSIVQITNATSGAGGGVATSQGTAGSVTITATLTTESGTLNPSTMLTVQ